jgi:hypothetical protein
MAEHYTTHFSTVKKWIESHNGFPAIVRGTSGGEYDKTDAIEISFDLEDSNLERIEWEEFFEWFQRENLALRYDNKEKGLSAFEFVDRDRVRSELAPETELPDTGDYDELTENITPDAD